MFFCDKINFSHNIGKDLALKKKKKIVLTTKKKNSRELKAKIWHKNNPNWKEIPLSVSSKIGLEKPFWSALSACMSEQDSSISF